MSSINNPVCAFESMDFGKSGGIGTSTGCNTYQSTSAECHSICFGISNIVTDGATQDCMSIMDTTEEREGIIKRLEESIRNLINK